MAISGRHQSEQQQQTKATFQLWKPKQQSLVINHPPQFNQSTPICMHTHLISQPIQAISINRLTINNSSNQSSIIMSLIGHHGGLQIGKAERPGPSLGKKINKDHEIKSEKTSSSLSQRIGGILHSQRRGDDRSETASISSVATEKRALLGDRNSSSSSRQASKLAKPNETLMPPVRFWN